MPVLHISDFEIYESAQPGYTVQNLYVRDENGQEALPGYTFKFNDARFSYDYLDHDLILNRQINFEALALLWHFYQ